MRGRLAQCFIVLAVVVALAGCGQTGALYLPDDEPAEPATTDEATPDEEPRDEDGTH